MDFHAYEYLALFNRNLDRALALLQRLEKLPQIDKELLRLSAAQIREIRAVVSQSVTEELNQAEMKRAARAYRKRIALEERLRARNS